jgi:type IV secretion system protein VirD4
MKQFDAKRFLILNLPFVLFFWLADKAGQAFRLAAGADISAKVLHLQGGFAAAFANPLPSFHTQDLLVGAIGAALIKLALHMKKQNAKKYRKGIEYGSARWGTPADIAPYIDPDFENNVLLTQTERITMNSRPKNPATAQNKNVLVIGGSGSGKTRFFVKPNLMQCVSKDYPVSYCVTDPKGLIC